MLRSRSSVLLCVVMVLSTAAAMTGCTTIQKGAAIGGAVGGGLGAAYGGLWSESVSAGEGLLLGAGGGTILGALVGADLDAQKVKDLQREVENLQALVDLRDEEVQDLKAKVGAMEGRLGEIDEIKGRLGEIDDLKRRMNEIDALKRRLQELEEEAKNARKRLDDLAKMKEEMSRLERELKKTKELAAAVEEFKQTAKGLEMRIQGKTLFRAGLAELTETGQKALDAIATTVKEKFPDKEISIEGHTDNQEINLSGWRSNWELGAARAQEVLHYLIDTHSMNPAKVSASTFGEFRPVATNDTGEGQGQNRRAVIVVLFRPADALANQATQ